MQFRAKALLLSSIIGAMALALVKIMNQDPRSKVVNVALSQLGEQNPDKYWEEIQPAFLGNPHGIAWCGGFALWVLRQAGLTDWTWQIGKGFASRLPITHDPQPGDIAYFDHLQHHAIVRSIKDGILTSIDGNQSPGERVLVRERPVSEVKAFYSIAPLVHKEHV
jgi:hypothetical protein